MLLTKIKIKCCLKNKLFISPYFLPTREMKKIFIVNIKRISKYKKISKYLKNLQSNIFSNLIQPYENSVIVNLKYLYKLMFNDNKCIIKIFGKSANNLRNENSRFSYVF